ncbi:MAG TPA: hypothetical protein VGL29_01155 [Blastocatellia bacterium]|jgi:hypothetical protein
MTLTEFSTLVASAGVLAGGAWALFNFRALNTLAKSRAELANLDLDRVKKQKEIEAKAYEHRQRELAIQELEQKARIGSVINVRLQASQLVVPDDSSLYVSAVVQVENKGTINTRLEFGDDRRPLSVYPVTGTDDTGKPRVGARETYGTPVSTSLGELSPSVNVRAGGCERIHFLFRVKTPGLYLLTFAVPLDADNQAIAEQLGFKFKGNWAAKEYVVVRQQVGTV